MTQKVLSENQPKEAINDEYQIRLLRLKKIQQSGVEAYPKESDRSHMVQGLLDDFDALAASEKVVNICGRIRSIRLHGGSCFINVEDESGKLQAYLKQDVLGDEQYVFFTDSFDIGDFIQVSGTLFTTKRGEKSLMVSGYKMLAKSLLPLPEKWHGLTDVETRFRQRYLDLLANPEVRQIFNKRSQIVQFIRNYFINLGFTEVDTPILQLLASGAIAKPFKTHHNALDTEMSLRVAPELYLKKLVVGGFEKVFEIARCFRNEGIDYSHNPEFTQIEFYWAYKDYNDLMVEMEKFLPALVKQVCGELTVDYDGNKINFAGPYPRVDFREALLEEAGIDLDKFDADSLAKEAKKKGLKVESTWGKGKLADELYKKFVRPKLINPTYIINHPIELSPLAKKIDDRPNYVERFQLIIGGRIELMNAFSELNDPLDQEERFKFQSELAERGDEEAMGNDDDFVNALKYGMPPTAGLGMGIDRLCNVLTNTHNIKEVILFPILKPEDNK
ncbi:MAG: lysine--tRNA ligase [Candidatus Komeilibacteria bacterium]|nr:lysine--tRNA ligase [Candidatus Komeilibacteria bacterium]